MSTVFINNVELIGEMENVIFTEWKKFANMHKQSHMYRCYKMHGNKRKNYNILNSIRWNTKDHEIFKSKGFKGIREYYVGDKYD